MASVRLGNDRPAVVRSLCRTLYILVAWVQVATAVAQGVTENNVSLAGVSTAIALIPSAPRNTAIIPSAPPRTEASPGIIPSAPRTIGLIPSQLPQSGLIPSQPPSGIIPSAPPSPPPGLIPSAPSGLIPSAPGPGQTIPQAPTPVPQNPGSITSNVGGGPMPSIVSTEEGLRPIPPPTTAPGDPDGHHEISEPNFTATRSCKGCSPVIEVSVTGFDDWPSTPGAGAQPEHAGTTEVVSPIATITAGPSPVIINKDPSGTNFIIGGPSGSPTTVTAGQTVTVDNTPIVIQTSSDKTEVIVAAPNTTPVTIAVTQNAPEGSGSQITPAPILAPLTIGTQTITADASSHYIIGSQTLQPGGTPITVDGTTISLLPSATAIVVNGQTSGIAQAYGAIYTTTASAVLTFNNQVYTANKAGYYIISPGTTLIPGGPPVTVSGTVISLEPKGTAAVIGGSTSAMTPATTVVTLTRSDSGGAGGNGGGQTGGGVTGGSSWSAGTPLPPLHTGKHNAAGMVRSPMMAGDGIFEGIVLLMVLASGWLAVWL